MNYKEVKKPVVKAKQIDLDMDEAVKRIYQKYGASFSAFSKAVLDELKLERNEPSDQAWSPKELKRA